MKLPGVMSKKTQWELENPAPSGQRHAQIIRVALSLASCGFEPQFILHRLRPNYGPDVSDWELDQAVAWAVKKVGNASSEPSPTSLRERVPSRTFRPAFHIPRISPVDAVKAFLRGFECGEPDVWDASPVPLADHWRDDCPRFLSSLYAPTDRINIVAKFAQEGAKARPIGRGWTFTRDEWLADIRKNGVPQGDAGAWIRMNPLSGDGISDSDVASFRFALLEFDNLPISQQLAVLALLPLPIVAIVSSGGRSLHAWVRVNAADSAGYRQTVAEMFSWLIPLGIDPANRNPSRLARLPGAQRAFGGSGDSCQRLLYLNPNANECHPIFLK